MTTLLVTENFPPVIGGSARWMWELYRRWSCTSFVVAAGCCPGDVQFDRTHNLSVHRLPLAFPDRGVISLSGWRRYHRAATALGAVIDRTATRRLHCARVLPEGWLASRGALPYGCYVHGEELSSIRQSRQLTWMAGRVMRRAGALVANSRHTAARLACDWGIGADRVTVLNPGVDTDHFVPAVRDPQVRAALGWGERPVVLTVGRLQARKGHDRMIDAVGLLRARFPSLLYAVVGDGEERAALEARVRRAGLADSVRFHGAVGEAELVRAYQQCDLFALPNRTVAGDFEGFGMVLLEAQACGRPVLAGDSGGTADAVRPGETGVIVDCAHTEPLADAVAALLSDPARRARMGLAGRRWTEAAFDFDARASEAAGVLERMTRR